MKKTARHAPAPADLLLRIIAAVRSGQTVLFYPNVIDQDGNTKLQKYDRVELDIQPCTNQKTPALMSRAHFWKGPKGMLNPPTDGRVTHWSRSRINHWSLNDFLEEITFCQKSYPDAFTGLPAVTDETKAADPIIANLSDVISGKTVSIPHLGDTTFSLADGFVYQDSHAKNRALHNTEFMLTHNITVTDKASHAH